MLTVAYLLHLAVLCACLAAILAAPQPTVTGSLDAVYDLVQRVLPGSQSQQTIKNQSVDGSKQACSYDLSKIRDTLFHPAKTLFIKLVTCPQSSPLSASPFAGCFPVKRSVRQLMTESLAIVLIPISGGIDFCARDDEHSCHYSPS